MKDFLQSPNISKIIGVLAIVLVLLLVFQVGMAVGYRRGTFSAGWNMAYQRDLRDPHFLFAPFTLDNDRPDPHGVFGRIVSVRLPEILVKGPSSVEQTVEISPTTTIRSMHSNASTSDLVIGGQVTIIGEPRGNGTIRANFIRLIPVPPGSRQ